MYANSQGKRRSWNRVALIRGVSLLSPLLFAAVIAAQFVATDPGVRTGSVDAGQALSSLTQTAGGYNFFNKMEPRLIAPDSSFNSFKKNLATTGLSVDDFRTNGRPAHLI